MRNLKAYSKIPRYQDPNPFDLWEIIYDYYDVFGEVDVWSYSIQSTEDMRNTLYGALSNRNLI